MSYTPSYASPQTENVWILVDNRDMYEVELSVLRETLSMNTMHNALALIQNMGTRWPPQWASDITAHYEGCLETFKTTAVAILRNKYDKGFI